MARTLFLTGRPGVGKTTVIKAVALALGDRVDGFYTEEVRHQGQRQGFQLVTLQSDERATLAHVHLRGQGRPGVGRYGVDVAALEQVGVAALERAIARGRFILIDEIGKMELFSQAFKKAVLAAVKGQAPVIATVMAGAHPWVDALKARPDVTLWQVTIENRDPMPARVLNWAHSAS